MISAWSAWGAKPIRFMRLFTTKSGQHGIQPKLFFLLCLPLLTILSGCRLLSSEQEELEPNLGYLDGLEGDEFDELEGIIDLTPTLRPDGNRAELVSPSNENLKQYDEVLDEVELEQAIADLVAEDGADSAAGESGSNQSDLEQTFGTRTFNSFEFETNFELLDDFNSHTWVDAQIPNTQTGIMTYDDKRKTGGRAAWHVVAPMRPVAEVGLDGNAVWFSTSRRLAQPEDWSTYKFVTIDIYMEENPTGLSEARLRLTNSAGESEDVTLILGWQLFQWENRQMTFSLETNAHRYVGISESILSDVVEVTLAVNRYSDGGIGEGVPLDQLNFHIDNMRLGGERDWDTFDGPGLDWHTDDALGLRAGITNNRSYAESAGSLYLGWDRLTAEDERPGVKTDRVAVAGVGSDWGEFRTLQARVNSSSLGLPILWRLSDGEYSLETLPVEVKQTDEWSLLEWEIPQNDPDFNYEAVSELELLVEGGGSFSFGELYLDDLKIGRSAQTPYQVEVKRERRRNVVSWQNPVDPLIENVAVWVSENGFSNMFADGYQLCVVQALEDEGSCAHNDLVPGQDYYYTVFGLDRYYAYYALGAGQTVGSQEIITFSPPNAGYEVGFHADNGAMLYIKDLETQALISHGSLDDNLWKIVFYDESELPALYAKQFRRDSDRYRFRYNEAANQLIYEYVAGDQALTLVIDLLAVDQQGFDMKARLVNNTGFDVRTVILPYELSFATDRIKQVLLPIQEGLVLLPQFFKENRSSIMNRPPMFADLLALDSIDGDLGLYMIQDSSYQAELIPGHDPALPVFQPNNLGVGGRGELSYMQFEMVTYIPQGVEWESGTLRYRINHNFRQLAADYRQDNRFDDPTLYPTLRDKLDPFGQYDALARSSILSIEVYKLIEWLKAEEGKGWETIENEWLQQLPSPGVLHLTHWQYGRDWYDSPFENHKLEDDHPEALPIWWDRYGDEESFYSMLAAGQEQGFLFHAVYQLDGVEHG